MVCATPTGKACRSTLICQQHTAHSGLPPRKDPRVQAGSGESASTGKLFQFGPGDPVAIYLGNQLVVDGFLELRQVGFDADRHAVELMGVNVTAPMFRSSVDTLTGSFDDMSWEQIALKVISPYDVGLKIVGALNPLHFVKLSNQPGEMIWDFLERIARPRGILLSNDSFSNVLAVGTHGGPTINSLIEGKNIKRCSAIFHQEHNYTVLTSIGQSVGTDGHSGSATSDMAASWSGSGYIRSKLIIPAESMVWGVNELSDRARWEAMWLSAERIRVFITVSGWYRTPKDLWWILDEVFVRSAMIPMEAVMKIQAVTFKQDDRNGTETEIELRMPWGLNSTTLRGKIEDQPPGPVQPDQQIPPIP